MKKLTGGYWCWAAPHQWHHNQSGWLSVISRDERGYHLSMTIDVESILDAQRITDQVIEATFKPEEI